MISKCHDEIFIYEYIRVKQKYQQFFFLQEYKLTKFKGSCCVVTTNSTGSLLPWLQIFIMMTTSQSESSFLVLKMVKQKALMEGWARAQGMVCTKSTQFINFLQTVLVSSSTGNYHQRFTRKKTRDIRMEPLFSLSPIFPPQKQGVGSPR